jgi:hypothetical protein
MSFRYQLDLINFCCPFSKQSTEYVALVPASQANKSLLSSGDPILSKSPDLAKPSQQNREKKKNRSEV